MSDEFYRMKRLPPYVIAEVNAMRAAARAGGEDIIDLGNVSLHADAEITEEQARAAAVRTHRRLYDHIVARDISGAESLWRRHLDESMGYLLGENAAMTVSDLFD